MTTTTWRQCTYCKMDTAGEHEWDCPWRPDKIFGKPAPFVVSNTTSDHEISIILPKSVRVELLDSRIDDSKIVVTYRVHSNEQEGNL